MSRSLDSWLSSRSFLFLFFFFSLIRWILGKLLSISALFALLLSRRERKIRRWNIKKAVYVCSGFGSTREKIKRRKKENIKKNIKLFLSGGLCFRENRVWKVVRQTCVWSTLYSTNFPFILLSYYTWNSIWARRDTYTMKRKAFFDCQILLWTLKLYHFFLEFFLFSTSI